MKGDFSFWRYDPLDNDQGLLYQQGRVTRDADMTASELIDLHWRNRAGRDIIGARVAAVPAGEPDGFKVESAKVTGGDVHIKVKPGRAWADGLLLYLPPDPANPSAARDRVATYLESPPNPGGATVAGIGDNVRDTVVLEVALEELNGFQEPDRLIEPALGGPDTAERISARYGFRLLRLGAGEDCHTVLSKLADGPAGKGKLTVSLTPPVTVSGECPTVAGGGYTGFEHNLYRIEVAHVNSGAPRFKWSQFNGGLVGRGTFLAGTPKRVVLTANRAAIVNSGLTQFYLEALQKDENLGHWRVVYGAMANLNNAFDLELTDPPVFGAFPSTAEPVFFRLWNGLENVSGFTNSATPQPLRDGIHLVFDPPAGSVYRPGDYWVFPVRAGEISNPQTLVNAQPPLGPRLRRVPLAEIYWTAARDTTVSGTIEDCRKRFRPLVNQKVCCSFLVGDGVSSFGDFNSLEEAASHLPASGGELCLLPGTHYANLKLEDMQNVAVRGCTHRSLLFPRPANPNAPVLHIKDCVGIEIRDLDLAHLDGVAVLAEASGAGKLKDVSIHDNRVLACEHAIRVNGGARITIARNRLHLVDGTDGLAVISMEADDSLVERNELIVIPAEEQPPATGGSTGGGQPNPADPCANAAGFYQNVAYYQAYLVFIWTYAVFTLQPSKPYKALGGLHLRPGCERVRVSENKIRGGTGNGVTLGGVLDPQAAAIGETGTAGAPAAEASTPSVTVGSQAQFIGLVQDTAGEPVAGVDVYLQNGNTYHDTSGAQGTVTMQAYAGLYEVTVSSPWRITQVTEATDATGVVVHTITVAPLAAGEILGRGFLYEISILENDIAAMGLSGIGFGVHPGTGAKAAGSGSIAATNLRGWILAYVDLLLALLSPRDLIATSDLVRDVVIRGNRIHGCLLNPFDDQMKQDAKRIGRGGVSLGLVDSAVISQNHITDNGPRGTDPVCGIFVGYGNDIEVTDNVLAGNGAITADYETNKLDGIRGGVYLRFAGALTRRYSSSSGRKPGLRVHDNRVDQPAGRALTALAFGPVSCANNHLNSERSGRMDPWDAFVGGVLLLNLGGIHRFIVALFGAVLGKYTVGNALIDLQALEDGLPGGETLFDDNYVRVGTANLSFTAQLVGTLDDLSYDSNQASVYRSDQLLANTVLFGLSLRATDSRFREDVDQTLSLWSMAVHMNVTAHNQADHCLRIRPAATANPLPTIDGPNQVRDVAGCSKFNFATHMATGLMAYAAQRGAGASVVGGFATANMATLRGDALYKVYGTVQQAKYQQLKLYQTEAARQTIKYGEASPMVAALKQDAAYTSDLAVNLGAVAQVARVQPPAVAPQGAVIDGRVTDDKAMGRAGMKVELVRANGTRIETVGVTDVSGYYALALNPAKTTALAKEEAVYLHVTDAGGNTVYRSAEKLDIAPDGIVRQRIAVPAKPVARSSFGSGTVIFRAPGAAGAGTAETGTPVTGTPPPAEPVATRYLGNSVTHELHDLQNQKPRCQIGKIPPERQRYFKTTKEALAAGYDYCAYCFGKDKSRR